MKLKKLLLLAFLLTGFVISYAQEDTSLVNVYFFKNKFFLTQKGKENLQLFMEQHKNDKHLYVVGRCDKWGALEYNDWLSVQRAKTVADFMRKNGFPTDNIDTIKGYGKRKLLAIGTPRTQDSLNRVVTITGSFAVVKQIIETKREAPPVVVAKKHVIIDTVYLNENIMVPPPYPAELLAIHKFPHKGDILKIERVVNVRNDTPFVMRKLYVASETMEEPKPVVAAVKPPPPPPPAPAATAAPSEIAEDTKNSDLNQQVTDKLKNSKIGESLVLRGINFDNGYHKILKKDMPSLEAVLAAMKEIPTLKIEIQGHVCCWPLGEEGFDRDTKEYSLSYNRAKAVYDYLIANGVTADRLTFAGYGMKHPLVYPEKNKNDEYKNRRVEFKIVSK